MTKFMESLIGYDNTYVVDVMSPVDIFKTTQEIVKITAFDFSQSLFGKFMHRLREILGPNLVPIHLCPVCEIEKSQS